MVYGKVLDIPANTEARVILMRGEKRKREEIANTLGIRLRRLDTIVGSLIARGLTERRPGNWNAAGSRSEVASLENPRTSLIIAMKKDHRTLAEIKQRVARDIGTISRERVRQILKKVCEVHGEDAVKPDVAVWSVYKAVDILRGEGFGVSYDTIAAICKTGVIDCLDRPRQDARFLVTKRGLSQLRRHPRVTGIRKCAECGKRFFSKNRKPGTITCSPECHTARDKRNYRERGKHPPDPMRMYRLHRALMNTLPAMGGRTEWMTWRAALGIAGITSAQFEYLRVMKMISVGSDRKRTWRGKPRRLYSAEEMKIVRRVFRRYRGKMRRR